MGISKFALNKGARGMVAEHIFSLVYGVEIHLLGVNIGIIIHPVVGILHNHYNDSHQGKNDHRPFSAL